MKKVISTIQEKLNFDFWRKLILTFLILCIIFIFGQLFLEIVFAQNLDLLSELVSYKYEEKQCCILIFTILLLLFYILKLVERNSLPNRSTLFTDLTVIAFCIWYILIRKNIHEISGVQFEFAKYHFVPFYYLDFLLISLVYSVLKLSWGIWYLPKFIVNNSIWINDKPLKNFDEDNYGRKELIEKIINEINSFSDNDSSFSIGILGPWGSGKSTFIKAIREKINMKHNLIIDFNPWQYPEETNLTRVFLKEVENRLSKHSYSANRINDYAGQLFKGNTNWWGVISNVFIAEKSIEFVHNSIKQVIIRTKKKLVVFIDDIDRLQEEEVYEVLTIIRNVGNLPNTVFVLAYDKDYLLNILGRKIYNPQGYLSKFFQVEFSLSRINESNLREDLAKELARSIPDFKNKDVTTIASSSESDFENADSFLQGLESIDLIKSRRDIIKLMNVVNTTWPILKNSLIFKDYFQLEILRLKYGNVYSKIKYQATDLINMTSISTIIFHEQDEILSILIEDTNDRKIVSNLLISLFPNTLSQNQNKKAVNNSFKFDAYFQNVGTSTVAEDLENFRIK